MGTLLYSLLALLGIHWIAMMSPGPNVLLVTQTAIARSRLDAVFVGLGVSSGGFIWSVAAILGVAVLLTHFQWIRYVLHLIGGAYLCYLAFKLWKNSATEISLTDHFAGKRDPVLKRSYAMGITSSLTSPKTAVYFASILPAFLPPSAPGWFYALIVLSFAASSVLWYSLLAYGMSHLNIRRLYLDNKKWVDRLSGAILGLFGLRLMLSAR